MVSVVGGDDARPEGDVELLVDWGAQPQSRSPTAKAPDTRASPRDVMGSCYLGGMYCLGLERHAARACARRRKLARVAVLV